jgi:hypothetical protein
MNFTLIVYNNVADEVESAALYYESRQGGLGLRFLNDWEKALSVLENHPLGYQKKYKTFRQIQLQKFPYLIMYEIDGDNILVYRIINAKRHPNKRFNKKQ